MVWFTFVASDWQLSLKTNYFQLLCLLQIAVSVNGPIVCMCYRRYWDLVCVSKLSWVSFHLISLCLIPFLGFQFVFVCVYESVYIQMPSQAVTESPHWLSDIQKSLWHEMNGQFWQAAPQSSLQDFPKALPFCYVQYLQLYCLCVLIIVCDSWQVYKRYTINLPIECFSVQVSEILYPVFPTYGGDTGKCMSLLLLSVVFLQTLERIEHSDSVRFESTLKAFIELARIEHFHHKPAHLGGF